MSHRSLFWAVGIGLALVALALARGMPVSTGRAAASEAIPVSSCTVIGSPGVYVLTKDIDAPAAYKCIEITVSDVTLDGAGRHIQHWHGWWGWDGHGYGVYVHNPASTLNNVRVKNLTAVEWGYGIYLNNVRDSSVASSNVGYNSRGITLENSQNIALFDNSVTPNYYYGVRLSSSHNNTLTNNLVSQDYFYFDGILLESSNGNLVTYNTISSLRRYGLQVVSSTGNQVYHNNFLENAIQASVSGGGSNSFNLPFPSGGNYWSNFDTPAEGCNNANGDNFCDAPYAFAGGQDNLPWTKMSGWEKVPPTTTDNAAAAWQRYDFTVTLTCTDNPYGSGCLETRYRVDGGAWQTGTSTPISSEGDHLIEYYSVDKAGNQEAVKSTHAKLDKTAPSTNIGFSGTAGNNGWYTSDVIVALTPTDNQGGSGPSKTEYSLQGSAWTTYAAPFTITNELTTTVYYRSTDNAGNVEATKAQAIKIDKTPPAITGAAATPPNTNGWYKTDVVVHFTASDAASGLASATPDQTLSSEGANQQVAGTATDNAGNTASFIVKGINIDKAAPTTSPATSPVSPDGSNGWYRSRVTVTLAATDNPQGSGVAATYYTLDGGGQLSYGGAIPLGDGRRSIAYWSLDQAGNVEVTKTLPINVDTIAPTITASGTPPPNGAGWNRSDVTVHFQATDSGSGLATVTPDTVVSTEGAGRNILGTATDLAGNSASITYTVNLDKTPPTITGSRTPAANAHGWNNTDVTVSFLCDDGLSGVATCGPTPQVVSTEGEGQSRTGTATDKAGNEASATVRDINIDRTAPTTTAAVTPPPNANGWNRTDVSVTLAATDTLSGIARTEYKLNQAGWVAYAGPLSITAEGIHTLLYRSLDRADNQEADRSLTIRIDKTPPEAYNQFDPASKDLLVFGRDALSGVPAGAVAPISVSPAKWGEGDEDEDDDKGNAELRTYKIVDLAGNILVLVEKIKREGKEIKARVVSLQYNGGPVISPSKNKKSFEWSVDKDGTLKELEQDMEVGMGKERRQVEAKYEAKKNQTTIKVDEPKPETKVVRAGLALLRLATDKGKLGIEY